MSAKYDEYLKEHKSNVRKAFEWLKENVQEIFEDNETLSKVEYLCTFSHDASKTDKDEYNAYDEYFYGNRSFETCENFNKAWLMHIHKNPHHWQHWVLHNDDPNEGIKLIEIPDEYIIEMICDWWSFSWKQHNLFEIFKWYSERSNYMLIEENSKNKIEKILNIIKNRLLELENLNNDYVIKHSINLNKDFYKDLPGAICLTLNKLISEYGDEEWFENAFNEYREHVLNSDIDDMRMPGYIFNKYIKEDN